MAEEEASAAQFIAPVAGGVAVAGLAALAGATFFTPLTWFAIGWMIGSFLFGPKQEKVVIDPGKAEMPIINNAVRGKIVQVSIGTVKVSSNIIWTNDFRTVKNKSSTGGGGKLGGSSGGKGPEVTTISYEYFWDFIYHMGIPLQPVGLLRAWLGPDELDSSFIAAISQNSSVESYVGIRTITDAAQLEFEEAHFFGGDNPQIATWAHLDTVQNSVIGWPKTAWLGIKQAKLGATPRVPQLTFEIGPGGASFEASGGYLNDYDFGSLGGVGSRGSSATLSGHIIPTTAAGTSRPNRIVRLSDGALVDSISDANIATARATLGLGGGDPTNLTQHAVLPGTNYIVSHSNAAAGGNARHQYLFLWEIVNDAKVLRGGCRIVSANPETYHEKILGVSTANPTYPISKAQPILIAFNNFVGTDGTRITTWPSINDLEAVVEYTDSTALDDRTANLNSYLDDNFGNHSSYQNNNGSFWFIGSSIDGRTRMYFMVSKSDMEYDLDVGSNNFVVSNNRASYPSGFIGYLDLGIPVADTPISVTGGINFVNDDFVDSAGNSVVPFDDAWKTLGGSDIDPVLSKGWVNDYMTQPTMNILSTGAVVVIFSKGYQLVSEPSWVTIRAFALNPLTLKWTQLIKGSAPTYDTVVDLGASSSQKHNWFYRDNSTFYVESLNTVYQLACIESHVNVPEIDNEAVISKAGSIDLFGNAVDINCAFVVRKVLTDPEAGMGVSESLIDETSYQAAYDYCETESFRISAIWSQERSRTQILDHILSTYGGYLVYSEGVIKFGFLQANETPVRTIDNDHLIREGQEDPVIVVPGARQDTYNLVKVNFYNREINYDQDIVELGDEVDQDMTGVRAMEFAPGFVMSRSMATKIASRGLWNNLYSKRLFKFKTGFKDFDLEPGDVITLVDSHFNLSEGCRITYRNQIRHGIWENIAIQELNFALGAPGFDTSTPNPNDGNFYIKGGIPRDFIAYEVPKEFHETGGTKVWFNWYSSSPGDRGAVVNISPDGVTYTAIVNGSPYPDTGVLLSPLSADKNEVFAENIDVLLSPSSSWLSNSPVYVHSGDTMTGVTIDAMHLGAGAMWVGSEMLIYANRTLVDTNKYRLGRVYRGWGGTHIHAHNSGDFWYSHADAIGMEYNENRVGETIYYKIQPYGNQGILVDISSIVAKQHTFTGGFKLPSIQSTIHPWVGSKDLGTLTKYKVGSLDIQLRWEDVSNNGGYGRGGYGAGGYGRFTTDAESVSYRVEVYGSGDILVNSLSVNTPAYDYTEIVNSGDNGAWRGNVAFKITPFNRFGDAPRFGVISMDLYQ